MAGFKHVQLELFRQAAQDLLASFAPDLAAQLLSIFRAYVKQPAKAMSAAIALPGNQAALGDEAVADGELPTLITTATDSAAAAEACALGNADTSASGLLSLAGRSQAELSQIAVSQVKPSTISFPDTFATPLLHGESANNMSQLLRSPNSFSSAHIPSARPSRLSLQPAALSGEDNLVGGMPSAVLPVGQESPRSIASVRAQAWNMQQQMEQDAKHGHLVVLQPQETVQQTSHVLVMKGSVRLEGCPVNTQLVPGRHSFCKHDNQTRKQFCSTLHA